MVNELKIYKWIIIILVILLGGSGVAFSHYRNKAVEAAVADTIERTLEKEADYQTTIDTRNASIARLEKLNAAYKADIDKIMAALRQKAEEVSKLRKEYAVLKRQAPVKKTILREVTNASTKDISDKLSNMGYTNSIASY